MAEEAIIVSVWCLYDRDTKSGLQVGKLNYLYKAIINLNKSMAWIPTLVRICGVYPWL